MPSPIGDRYERFPLDSDFQDTDPSGNVFLKASHWEGNTLTTVARDTAGKKADNVTMRRIDDAGRLIQTTTQGGVSFERVYERK